MNLKDIGHGNTGAFHYCLNGSSEACMGGRRRDCMVAFISASQEKTGSCANIVNEAGISLSCTPSPGCRRGMGEVWQKLALRRTMAP